MGLVPSHEGGLFRKVHETLHSRKLTWKPKRVPIRTTVPSKAGYMGFHVSLGECSVLSDNKE